MNPAGPSLRDIHLPPAAWWPPALGWWLLLGAVVVLAAAVACWWRWRRRRGTLLAVLREIDALEATHARNGDDACVADAASGLLRRVACRIEPSVAGENGEAWRAFLQRYAHTPATQEALAALLEVRYRARPTLDVPVLCAALRAWCRTALRGRGACAPYVRAAGGRAVQP